MLAINVGVILPLDDVKGLKFSLGASPFSIKTISYSATFYYTFPEDMENFSYFMELGLPLAYFDLLEDRYIGDYYVDWDDNIDDPYAGWLTGLTLTGEFYKRWLVKVGISYWTEWQRDSGIKHSIIPLISLSYRF